MKALTTEEFKSRAESIFNGKYNYDKTDLKCKDGKGKVIITCPIHGDFKQYPYNHLRGIGCPSCANNNKKSKEEVIKEIKSVHGDKYIIPDDFEYLGNKKPIHMICPKHGDFYPIYRNFVVKGCDCLKCSHHIYTQDEFINDLSEIYGDKFIYDETVFNGYRTKIKLKCSLCGNIVEVYPMQALNGTAICNNCDEPSSSTLEREMAAALDNKSIGYIQQYTEEWLVNKQKLHLDFYLPKYNIAIECQGRFHFEPYKSGDEKCEQDFIKQKERDSKKLSLCEEHGIKMMYYSDIKVNDYYSKIYNSTEELINKITNLKY